MTAVLTAGAEFQVNTYTQDAQWDSSVAALSDGGFVITWMSAPGQDGASSGIYAQRYDATGTPWVRSLVSIRPQISRRSVRRSCGWPTEPSSSRGRATAKVMVRACLCAAGLSWTPVNGQPSGLRPRRRLECQLRQAYRAVGAGEDRGLRGFSATGTAPRSSRVTSGSR